MTGQLAPEHGGRLIWLGVWPDSNYPAVLRPLVEGVIQWEDNPRETYRQQIIDGARQILQEPQPPDPG